MTDLEITVQCAAALGYRPVLDARAKAGVRVKQVACFDPINDDAQAMGLQKRFRVQTRFNVFNGQWSVKEPVRNDGLPGASSDDVNLNRAICECVAKMEEAAQ